MSLFLWSPDHCLKTGFKSCERDLAKIWNKNASFSCVAHKKISLCPLAVCSSDFSTFIRSSQETYSSSQWDIIQTVSPCDTLLPKHRSESDGGLRSSAICRVAGYSSWEQSLPGRLHVNDWQPGALQGCLYETWEHEIGARAGCIWVMNIYLLYIICVSPTYHSWAKFFRKQF